MNYRVLKILLRIIIVKLKKIKKLKKIMKIKMKLLIMDIIILITYVDNNIK